MRAARLTLLACVLAPVPALAQQACYNYPGSKCLDQIILALPGTGGVPAAAGVAGNPIFVNSYGYIQNASGVWIPATASSSSSSSSGSQGTAATSWANAWLMRLGNATAEFSSTNRLPVEIDAALPAGTLHVGQVGVDASIGVRANDAVGTTAAPRFQSHDDQLADVFGTATIASGSTTAAVIPTASGKATIRVTITGLTAAGGVLTPELSGDGTNYVPIYVGVGGAPPGTSYNTITADGTYTFLASASKDVELAVATAGSSAISVSYGESSAQDRISVAASTLPLGAATAAGQLPVGGPGTDASITQPTLLTVLSTFTVTQPGALYVQNQSAATIQVALDNGTSGPTILLLGPGGANAQGSSTDPLPWFTGRVRVLGASGAQFAARYK